MSLEQIRVAAVTPALSLADTIRNSEIIIAQILAQDEANVDIAVFPELCLSGYSCGDLFNQEFLINSCLKIFF